MYTFDSDFDPDHDDSDSNFCYSDIAFVELVPEESVVVVEHGEAFRTVFDILKVVIGTE